MVDESGKKDTEKNNRSKCLNQKLKKDGFDDFDEHYYSQSTENSATYTIANKTVNHRGEVRDLIVVVIRGTHVDEWKGTPLSKPSPWNKPFLPLNSCSRRNQADAAIAAHNPVRSSILLSFPNTFMGIISP